MKKKLFLTAVLSSIIFTQIFAAPLSKECDKKISIWKDVSGMEKYRSKLYFYQPEVTTDEPTPAVIVCPGGSYHHLGLYNEGQCSARWFKTKGIAAFVLEYRVSGNGFHYPAMMEDLQRSIQLVRENAAEFNIDPENVGIIGYSAGGHLVAWGAEFGNKINELEKLGIKTDVSLMPNWSVPVYPVVSMQDDIYHAWSRKSLIGTANPTQEQKDQFSLELHASSDMPPIYLVACHDDNVVKFENSARLFAALTEAGVDVTFAEYETGKHGFGMLNNNFMKTTRWNESLADWLIEKGFLNTQE